MIRAVRDNSILATVLGINVAAIRIGVFGLGSAIAGLTALLVALDVGMNPHMGMSALLSGAVALIIGGVGTFRRTHHRRFPARLATKFSHLANLGGVVRHDHVRDIDRVLAISSVGSNGTPASTGGVLGMNYLWHLLVMISIYATLAGSLNLVAGYAGLLSLCHAAFFGIGAYASTLLIMQFGFPYLLALLTAVVLTGALSLLIAIPALEAQG